MNTLGFTKYKIIGYSASLVLAIALSIMFENNIELKFLDIFAFVSLVVIFTISNIIIYEWFSLLITSKLRKLETFRLRSKVFSYMGIVIYLLIVILIVSGMTVDEIGASIVFFPLMLSVFLQDVLYIYESKIILFNKSYAIEEIMLVKIEKFFRYSYVVSIYTNINKVPKTMTLSKRYVSRLESELLHCGLNVENKTI